MKYSRILFLGALVLFGLGLGFSESHAASQDDCAIWLCLPGGFPSGCSGAYRAFKDRVKHARPPLPSLLSCTTGPNGHRTDGRYQLGYERFEPCEEGYDLREWNNYKGMRGRCFSDVCVPIRWRGGTEYDYCAHYEASPRPQPHYVKMWVSGEYIGQYFYQ